MELFRIEDRLGNTVSLTAERWNHLLKHEIRNPALLKQCLRHPDEIRQSTNDPDIALFYRKHDEIYICVIVHRQKAFIITAYKTETKKRGEILWKKE